jgi:hypothetical protein
MKRDFSGYENANLGFHSSRDLHALKRERDEFKSRQRTPKPAVKQLEPTRQKRGNGNLVAATRKLLEHRLAANNGELTAADKRQIDRMLDASIAEMKAQRAAAAR